MCVCVCGASAFTMVVANQFEAVYVPSALEREEVFCYVDIIGGNCWRAKDLKTWPPILKLHVPEPRFSVRSASSGRVFARVQVLLMSSSVTVSSR